MTIRSESRLERVLHARSFAVTAEVVPPRGGGAGPVVAQARSLVGYADAVNVTDSPTSSAHMSPLAGAAFVAQQGLEPIMQITTRDRNRLALTGDLLGGWALGVRGVLCLTGDPVAAGDHPNAREVGDLSVVDLVRFVASLRETGQLLSGAPVELPPRYFVGVADVPLAPDYDPARLEEKADAGADFVQTQIVYDVDAIGAWAEAIRERGIPERMFVMVGVAPPRSVATLRYVAEHLPGVGVPDAVMGRLDRAGDGGEEEGVRLTVEIIERLRSIPGIAGVHVMGLGHEEAVRKVIEAAGLLPRPEPPTAEQIAEEDARRAAEEEARRAAAEEEARRAAAEEEARRVAVETEAGQPAAATPGITESPEGFRYAPTRVHGQPQPQFQPPDQREPESQPEEPAASQPGGEQPAEPRPLTPIGEATPTDVRQQGAWAAGPVPADDAAPSATSEQPAQEQAQAAPQEPAQPEAASAWAPTHVVPAGGMVAWQAPHPQAPQSARLQPGLPVQVVERLGDWARVVASNGWWGWVDGRMLP